MKNRFPFARAGACLLLSASAMQVHAQQAADPQAAVPATRYQSALAARPEAEPASSPDQNWVRSNQTVAATNSMALTMKGMGGHAAPAQSPDPHAAHAGMPDMAKPDSPAMCAPGDKDAGAGGGCKMPCCQSGCCCKDKMNKPREAT